MKCKYGQNGAYEKLFRPNCPDSSECYEFELYTNADRIRAMSDEELADFIDRCEAAGYNDSSIARDENDNLMDTFDWLQQPAEEDT